MYLKDVWSIWLFWGLSGCTDVMCPLGGSSKGRSSPQQTALQGSHAGAVRDQEGPAGQRGPGQSSTEWIPQTTVCAFASFKEDSDFLEITLKGFNIAKSVASTLLSYHSFVNIFVILCRAQDEQHAQEVSRFQEELAEAHSQLQILRKQLDEELAKQPLTNQEVRHWRRLKYLADGDLHLNILKKTIHGHLPLIW